MPGRAQASRSSVAVLGIALLSACGGEVVGAAESIGGPDARSAGASAAANGDRAAPSGAVDACPSPILGEPRAVLASMGQYMNMLRDLLGPQAVSAQSAAAAGRLEFDVIDRPRMTSASLDRVLTLAEEAVGSVRGQSAALLGCSDHGDTACLRRGLGAFARRAYRRPLPADELDALMALRASALPAANDDAESATLLAMQAILVAPSALYRTEFRGTPQANTLPLSAYERASALAALLLDSVPDAELLDAADDGSLQTPAGLAHQLERLLATPRVQQHLTLLILNAYKIPKLFETPKDSVRFPEYSAELQASMYEESRRFVDDVLWTRKAPLAELIGSRRSFVDARLAAIYGVTAPTDADFGAVELPAERAGLLTQASVLSVMARTDKTSVVARGLFVRGPLLCLPKVPPPPAAVQAQVAAQLMEDASESALAAHRASTSPCNGCHALFDPFGLLLERFDAIGRSRPANGDGAFALPAPLQGEASSVAELAQQIVLGGRFTRCLAERTFAYALSEPQAPASDPCALDGLQRALSESDGSMPALITALVNEPAFFQRRMTP